MACVLGYIRLAGEGDYFEGSHVSGDPTCVFQVLAIPLSKSLDSGKWLNVRGLLSLCLVDKVGIVVHGPELWWSAG